MSRCSCAIAVRAVAEGVAGEALVQLRNAKGKRQNANAEVRLTDPVCILHLACRITGSLHFIDSLEDLVEAGRRQLRGAWLVRAAGEHITAGAREGDLLRLVVVEADRHDQRRT